MPCVFQRRFVTVMPERLDVEAMNRAAQDFVGAHDYSAFCGNPKFKKSTVREVYSVEVKAVGNEIQIIARGEGFLYNMVRIMVGTLVEIGRGERSADSIPELFGKKRAEAGYLVPPQGLCLMEVKY